MEPTPTDATADATTPAMETVRAQVGSVAMDVTRHPLEGAPPLAGLAAVSGLVATLLVRVLIPTRDEAGSEAGWAIVLRIGAFAVNLAAIASMVALVLGLLPWLRGNVGVSTRRRLLIASFGGMLLPVWGRAVFLPRDAMNGALASLGAAAACSLSTLLVISALRGVRARSVQMLPVAFITIATLSSLTLLTLQSIAVVAPFSRVHGLSWVIADIGEGAYLAVMLCAVTLVPPRPWSRRSLLAVIAGGLVALAVVIAFQVAVSTLSREFAMALYYAQHVTLFLDDALWVYAIPLAVGIGCATTAIVGNDPHARQLGIAVLAWIGSGYVARAPWRYTLLVLSACLVARAVSSRIATAASTASTATPTSPVAPTS